MSAGCDGYAKNCERFLFFSFVSDHCYYYILIMEDETIVNKNGEWFECYFEGEFMEIRTINYFEFEA